MSRKKIIKKRVKSLLLRQKKSKGGTVINLCQRYHVITAADVLLLSTNDFHQAWKKTLGQKHGTRLIRSDGIMLAYASTQSGGRIKKGFPKKAIFVGEHIEREAPERGPLMD